MAGAGVGRSVRDSRSRGQDASVTQSLLDAARELIRSPAAKAEYAESPDGFLAARGLGGLSATDLEGAVAHLADAMPADVARRLAPVENGAPAPPGPAGASALARVAAVPAAAPEIPVEHGGVAVPGVDPGVAIDVGGVAFDVGFGTSEGEAAPEPDEPDAEEQSEASAAPEQDRSGTETPDGEFGTGAAGPDTASPDAEAVRDEGDKGEEEEAAPRDQGDDGEPTADTEAMTEPDLDLGLSGSGDAAPGGAPDAEPPADDFTDVII